MTVVELPIDTIDEEFLKCETLIVALVEEYIKDNKGKFPKYLYIYEDFELQSILMYYCMLKYPKIIIRKHKLRTFMDDK